MRNIEFIWIISLYEVLMKIEDQVCSFEQAKKLVGMGLNLDTLFRFYLLTNDHDYRLARNLHEAYSFDELLEITTEGKEVNVFPAPTVAELGVLLPYTHPDNSDCRLVCVKGLYDFTVFYEPLKGFPRLQFIAVTEAQARAEALIWLIENKYLDPKTLTLE
jgi:hypothetical protein